jgi:beta-lactamase superfamily II metal-dependent hydrolase
VGIRKKGKIMKYKVEGRNVINCVYIIAIFAILFSNFFAEYLSIFLYLKPNYSFSGQTEIHFIDCGQGDAIAVKFPNNKVMLIDTGASSHEFKLMYYLDNIILNKSNKIDYLVLTHIDNDHSGNMLYILQNYDIGVFYRPKMNSSLEDQYSLTTSLLFDDIISIVKSKNIEMRYNQAGNLLEEGTAIVKWLSPINVDLSDVLESTEYSPVIKIEYKNKSALLTGDVASDIEKQLINYYSREELDIDILKLAHHGSAGSTCEEFLEVITPEFACVSVGKNTYGHPSNKVIKRILEYDKNNDTNLFSNLYSTYESGNIIFTMANEIDVLTIKNIDNYSFDYYLVYSIIVVVILVIKILEPYYKIYKKNIRFIVQNKKFRKYLEKRNNNLS